MIKWSNGMIGFQVFETHTMTIYKFYFDEGKLKMLHCCDWYSNETKFKDIYNPLGHQFILKEHFEEAFEVFCNTEDYDSIISFIEFLENDDELKEIAKDIIRKCSYQAAEKAHKLTKAVWQLERKK